MEVETRQPTQSPASTTRMNRRDQTARTGGPVLPPVPGTTRRSGPPVVSPTPLPTTITTTTPSPNPETVQPRTLRPVRTTTPSLRNPPFFTPEIQTRVSRDHRGTGSIVSNVTRRGQDVFPAVRTTPGKIDSVIKHYFKFPL